MVHHDLAGRAARVSSRLRQPFHGRCADSACALQPQPHHCFNAEAAFMQPLVAPLGLQGAHAVLGDDSVGLQWHLYQASLPGAAHEPGEATTLEVCMTKLCPSKVGCRSCLGLRLHAVLPNAAQPPDLLGCPACGSPALLMPSAAGAAAMDQAPPCAQALGFCGGAGSPQGITLTSGIRALLPGARIDDFAFEPCGYSMNGLEGPLASSIHVTPEDGWSYASFELSGPELPDVAALAAQARPHPCAGLGTSCWPPMQQGSRACQEPRC